MKINLRLISKYIKVLLPAKGDEENVLLPVEYTPAAVPIRMCEA